MKTKKQAARHIGHIGDRKVYLKASETESTDLADTFVRIITDGNPVRWLAKKGLIDPIFLNP